MTKVKLSDGTVINAESVELVNGVLKITTSEKTVEELAELFSNKGNTALIRFLTESGMESGYKTGFTSFGGIEYDVNGAKTISLFHPADVTEARIASVEGTANGASEKVDNLETTVNALLGTEG